MKSVYINRLLFFFITLSFLIISAAGSAENKEGSDSLKSLVSDSVITTKIKSGLAADENTKATSISVETVNGVVKLSGVVSTEKEAIGAVQIAASTDGVKDINTEGLKIQNEVGQANEQPIKDSYITAKVKGTLIREKLMNDKDFPAVQISVETKNGIVYLSGTVQEGTQLKKAVELTQSIVGVRKVISILQVSPQ